MKRSNRLILLVGIFLVIVAFVGILLLAQGPSIGGAPNTGTVPNTRLNYIHDDEHSVSCWVALGTGIDCLPDSEVK